MKKQKVNRQLIELDSVEVEAIDEVLELFGKLSNLLDEHDLNDKYTQTEFWSAIELLNFISVNYDRLYIEE